MKFGKTYTTLLPSFPESWQERAISYGQLKKLINNVVEELSHLGLDPAVLNQLLQPPPGEHDAIPELHSISKGKHRAIGERPDSPSIFESDFHPHAAYELMEEQNTIVPRLRLWVESSHPAHHSRTDPSSHHSPTEPPDDSTSNSSEDPSALPLEREGIDDGTLVMASSAKYTSRPNMLFALQHQHSLAQVSDTLVPISPGSPMDRFLEADDGGIVAPSTHPPLRQIGRIVVADPSSANAEEVIIPLTADTAFYQLLTTALRSLAEHQSNSQLEFASTITALATDISRVSRPSSKGRSDLYAWRSIFQLWVETQIFESTVEKDRGELEVEEAEKRLGVFADQVVKRGMGDGRTLKSKESRAVLERFLKVNVLLLDLKKFQRANAEAARKILKKHEKRTALMIPREQQDRILPLLASLTPNTLSKKSTSQGITLAHILVVQMTDALLPVIPSIEDYECIICTSIAYIPIRLPCCRNPIFCVRCLVKLQRRGVAECPLCRSPTVLTADRSNVDLALKRFMKDWFPIESKAKEKANHREAAEEEMRAMGFNVPKDDSCCVM